MPDSFMLAFGTTFFSMIKIFFIVLIAGACVRKNIITQEHLTGLSTATVDVFLPCLIFTNILFGLKPDEFTIWWVLPIVAIVMSVLGLGIVALLFIRELPEKMNMLPIGFVQNSGYLVLPIGAVLFPDQFELFSVYVFLYILGQNPIMWSVGKYMMTSDPSARMDWKGLVTPPLVSIVVSLLFVVTGFRDLLIIPDGEMGLVQKTIRGLLDAIALIGDATVPVALFVLGGMLGGITLKIRPYLWDTVRVSFVKFILIPIFTLAGLYYFDLGATQPLMAVCLVIQAAAAPAVAIMLQIKRYGGEEQKVGSILLVTYVICLVAMPVWVAIWQSTNP